MSESKKNYRNLVVNGCSYTETYASGNGHRDLASALGIDQATSLAIGGSANSRILRTTLKHSYQAAEPTLYVLGMTFISRSEIPILRPDDEFEGRWVNPQNQEFVAKWEHYWTPEKSRQFVELKQLTEVYSLLDRTEDLMYHMLSVVHSLQSRGHEVIMYQQADDSYFSSLSNSRLAPFQSCSRIVNGFGFAAIGYQHQHGVAKLALSEKSFIGPKTVPDHMRHPEPGHHQVINRFLADYINKNVHL